MWESPIDVAHKEMEKAIVALAKKLDEGTMKAVFEVGIHVDKEELIKALAYDRDQYNKGYREGHDKGWDEGYNQGCEDAHVHGVNTRAEYDSLFECSVCGWFDDDTYTAMTPTYNYCPGCGAKIDKEAEKNE